MTAPRRWKETPEAPVGVRELLAAGRASRSMDGAAFERGAARLAKLGVAPEAAAPAGVALGLGTKAAAAAVVGVVLVGAVAAMLHGEGGGANLAAQAGMPSVSVSASPSVAEARAPGTDPNDTPVAKTVAEVREGPRVEPATKTKTAGSEAAKTTARVDAAAEARPEAAAERASEDDGAGTLRDELVLLEQARTALAGDPVTALARVAEHRARFPSGALGAERDLIELDALRRAGRSSDARARAEEWLAREPLGLHARRVRAILATLPPRE